MVLAPGAYGGILCDIGSHQVDQFLYYTGSTQAEVVASQIANVAHPDKPEFQDFGDMVLRGNRGMGYVRLDWFTPDGLGTWGDGRLFILGTEGYIELRKYIDIAGGRQATICSSSTRSRHATSTATIWRLPFGPQFVVGHRQPHANRAGPGAMLLAMELVIKAQKKAKIVTFTS